MHGEARQNAQTIEATDARDEHLVRACDDAIDAARATIFALREARVRMVVRATREDGVESLETTITVAMGGMSVVTTPADAIADFELLRGLAQTRVSVPQNPSVFVPENLGPCGTDTLVCAAPLPLVWQNGSAAVLLHEAIGHASEHGAAPVAWPSWLSVDAPLAQRRATFRDVPLSRMTHLVARQTDAPFALPDERIEVHLVAGGAYDPLTDVVTINVAASSAGAFTIRRRRAKIAASLAGATGEPIRYPGVICSREGQELFVASHAPLIITDPLT
jgi:hypothetical protein